MLIADEDQGWKHEVLMELRAPTKGERYDWMMVIRGLKLELEAKGSNANGNIASELSHRD